MTPGNGSTAERDERHMRRCIQLAARALDAGDVPVGAVVALDDRTLGEGWERTRDRLDPAAHAEVEALRAACRALGMLDLSGATLYTTVEPCLLCSYAARQSRISRVVYGVPAGSLGGATGPFPLLTSAAAPADANPPAVEGGVLAQECQRLLDYRKGAAHG